MTLQDPSFRASKQIVNASTNSPPLRRGSSGPGVALLQAALMDLGYLMPVSTAKTAKPDGIYGQETKEVIADFQYKNNLKDDGVAGRNTIVKLDKLLMSGSKHPPTIVSNPRTVKPPPPKYKIGRHDPVVPMDPTRPHGMIEKTMRGYLIWRALMNHTLGGGGSIGIIFGQDAAKAMHHYLENMGSPLEMPFKKMLMDNKGLRDHYQAEVKHAGQFVEQLPLGNHNITSVSTTTLHATETKNWALAVGGLNAWGKAKASVKSDNTGRVYEMYFEYQFKDRYNFDKEKGWTLFKIPVKPGNFEIPFMDGGVKVAGDELEVRDTLLKRLHQEGRAKDFITYGSFIKYIRWRDGQSIPIGL